MKPEEKEQHMKEKIFCTELYNGLYVFIQFRFKFFI